MTNHSRTTAGPSSMARRRPAFCHLKGPYSSALPHRAEMRFSGHGQPALCQPALCLAADLEADHGRPLHLHRPAPATFAQVRESAGFSVGPADSWLCFGPGLCGARGRAVGGQVAVWASGGPMRKNLAQTGEAGDDVVHAGERETAARARGRRRPAAAHRLEPGRACARPAGHEARNNHRTTSGSCRPPPSRARTWLPSAGPTAGPGCW
jgi:hypothetical protein